MNRWKIDFLKKKLNKSPYYNNNRSIYYYNMKASWVRNDVLIRDHNDDRGVYSDDSDVLPWVRNDILIREYHDNRGVGSDWVENSELKKKLKKKLNELKNKRKNNKN